MKVLNGEAELDRVPVPIAGATLVLSVEDSSRADAPAVVILEHRICGISRMAGDSNPVQFALQVPGAPRPGTCWTLRARLCRDPGAGLQPGDYVSVRCQALAAAPRSGPLRIALQRLD